jgi:hypothetical protein
MSSPDIELLSTSRIALPHSGNRSAMAAIPATAAAAS